MRVEHGHFADGAHHRLRFWGVNLTDFAADSIRVPEKADADFWAAALARLGVNCVRLHNLDVRAPKGLIAAGRTDTRQLDPVELDKFDYFLAALKRHGIYLDFNLNVGRSYLPGDQVPDAELMGYAKCVTYYDPHLIELEREYARELLTHRNPYTGSDYAHEPAVAMVEILNENSLFIAWLHDRLSGTKTRGRPANWQDIPPHYARELTEQFNRWLERNQTPAQLAELRAAAHVSPGQPIPRLTSAEFTQVPRARFALEARFYQETEAGFFTGMRDYLRHDLGVQAPLCGGSDYSYGRSDYGSLQSRALLDVIDAHGPWESSPMVDEPLNSVPVRLARSAMAGKPFTVSEHNHRFPSDYTSEGISLLATYASFQDWDGIFLYTFELKPPGFHGGVGSRADLSFDPVKVADLATGALIFRRGDVAPARETVARSYSPQEIIATLLMPATAAGITFTPGFSPAVALVHGSRIATLQGADTTPVPVPLASPLRSDTGELAWYFAAKRAPVTAEDDQRFASPLGVGKGGAKQGVVTVDAPRVQALIGFLHQNPKAVSHLAAQIENPFASLVLESLDGQPITASSRMLLSATARDRNSDEDATEIEPVTGALTLRGLAAAQAVVVRPLNGAGTPEAAIPATQIADGWQLRVGRPATVWYEIDVTR